MFTSIQFLPILKYATYFIVWGRLKGKSKGTIKEAARKIMMEEEKYIGDDG